MTQVHWFPNYHDKFVVSGTDISLYQIRERDCNYLSTSEVAAVKLNNNLRYLSQYDCTVNQLSSEIRYQYIKTIAPSYHKNGEIIVAAGQANGKVVLCNFLPSQENHQEFTPRQQRPCLTLSWNQTETNLLAMGYEKNKSDHCISVWDTSCGIASDTSIINLIGLGETAHSVCWDKSSRILLAGMSQKYIKMMDLRQSSPIVLVANTRAVQSLEMNANNRYLVSSIDSSVNIWDVRMFERPISQFHMQKNIAQIAWSKTRNNQLTTIHRESHLINLIDIHWSTIETDMDPQFYFIKRVLSPFEIIDKRNKFNLLTKNLALENISWHPQSMERLLILSNTNILLDFKVSDRVCCTWDSNNKLWTTSTSDNGIRPIDISSSSSTSSSPTDSITSWDLAVNHMKSGYDSVDIAVLMKKRVQENYGHFPSLDQNAKLSHCPSLYCVWKVLGDMQKSDCLCGIRSIINDEQLMETVCESKTWNDFPTSGSIKVYRSGRRELAQVVCGWTFMKGGDEKSFIQKLCERNEHTRAAMMACFLLKVRYAIEILGKGADDMDESRRNELRMAAIALSGFNLDKSGIWRSQSANAYKQIIDPHLRAIFSFLSSESECFEHVLNETGVSLCDRIGFACSFLSDQKLNEFIRKTIQQCTDDGDLNGLLLTGNTLDGISLLQSYVDKTDDVQTAALIGSKILSNDLINDKRMQCWIQNYRELMDIWGLYEWRAKFDMLINSMRTPPKSPKSVFLLCSFCGKSVSAALQEEARHRNQVTQLNKLSSCPNCRKPLPRCALCLLHMGTPVNTIDNSNSLKSKPFSRWFSWCQTCRHGGHTEHLSEWFAHHTECPVTSCTCKCFAMDLPVPKFTSDYTS